MSALNVSNRTIFCRDNLDVLQGMNSASVDLIYLDPPFNTKKVFTAPAGSTAKGAEFSDIFRREDIKDEWVSAIKFENAPLYSFLQHVKTDGISYNYCYLVYMAIRLMECHRLLKATGSVYLHCDPTMSHYLKVVMDCLFAEKHFRNEIIWSYNRFSRRGSAFPSMHDIILCYGKTKNARFCPAPAPPKTTVRYEKGYHTVVDGGVKKLLVYDREKAKDKIAAARRQGVKISYTEARAPVIGDCWTDVAILNPQAKERTGYPTQKPVALLERIIKASSHEGDVVLDPFCGCATTCVAAEKLARQWIGVDVSHKAYDLVRERLKKEIPARLFDDAALHFETEPPARDEEGKTGDSGYVYVISNPAWKDVYKVGIARDVNKRLAAYQTSSPRRDYVIEYAALAHNYKEIENAIFARFHGERENEWVEAGKEEIIAAIKQMLR